METIFKLEQMDHNSFKPSEGLYEISASVKNGINEKTVQNMMKKFMTKKFWLRDRANLISNPKERTARIRETNENLFACKFSGYNETGMTIELFSLENKMTYFNEDKEGKYSRKFSTDILKFFNSSSKKIVLKNDETREYIVIKEGLLLKKTFISDSNSPDITIISKEDGETKMIFNPEDKLFLQLKSYLERTKNDQYLIPQSEISKRENYEIFKMETVGIDSNQNSIFFNTSSNFYDFENENMNIRNSSVLFKSLLSQKVGMDKNGNLYLTPPLAEKFDDKILACEINGGNGRGIKIKLIRLDNEKYPDDSHNFSMDILKFFNNPSKKIILDLSGSYLCIDEKLLFGETMMNQENGFANIYNKNGNLLIGFKEGTEKYNQFKTNLFDNQQAYQLRNKRFERWNDGFIKILKSKKKTKPKNERRKND